MSTLPVAQPAAGAERRRHLYGPVWDFLLLGGGSLFALIAIFLLLHGNPHRIEISMTLTIALSHLINHPHFAHSYQIFYGGFGAKLTTYPPQLRRLYFLCGIAVPAALAALLLAPVYLNAPRALGLCINAMLFFVGWHYVKQGYGMAMVDAALKKAYFEAREKDALLRNAYAVWIMAWLLTNHLLRDDSSYWGIPFQSLPIPRWMLVIAGVACTWTTVTLMAQLLKRRRSRRPVAWNGLLAYLVSLYAWLLIQHPLMLLWIPLFHSLQYMAVVWRFQVNRSNAVRDKSRSSLKNAFFAVAAMALGYLGFWQLPLWLDSNVQYDHGIFGDTLFLAIFWIFINIHHYFLDTVMWRKGNPDVQKHLFSS